MAEQEHEEVEPGDLTNTVIPEAVRLAAEEKPELTQEEAVEATEWLLGSFDEGGGEITHTLKLNVGSPTKKKWITWAIRAVDGQKLRKIRDDAAGNRSMRRAGAVQQAQAMWRANLNVVVEGTVEPNLRAIAVQRGIADPAYLVEEAFAKKPGLIDQIAGEITTLSGYDDEDIQDSTEVVAAGNS